MKREEDMKRFSVLVCCLSIGLAVFCRPTPANAQSAVIGGCGFVLSSDCTSPDKTSLAKSVKISLNAAGVWTSDCSGTTTTTPTTATKCDGENTKREQYGSLTGRSVLNGTRAVWRHHRPDPLRRLDRDHHAVRQGPPGLQVQPERNRQITSYV